jgi:hypothetical protein
MERRRQPRPTPCRLALAAVVLIAAPGCGDPGRPPLGVLEAVELGVVPQSATITGRDGADSALLWGHSVWTFGDTVLAANDAAGTNWHHNSFSVTADLAAADGIDGLGERTDAAGAPVYFIAPTAAEEAFNAAHRGDPCAETPCGARWAVWPGTMVFDAARGRALVSYGLIYAEPGDFNFRGVGQSFAVWSDYAALPERPVVAAAQEHPTLLFLEDEPGYGGQGAAIVDDDLWAFACTQDGLAFPCTLGRVPLDRLFERAAWQYWTGSGWSAAMSDARTVFDGGTNTRVAFNDYLGRWTAIYSAPISNDVVIRTAPALEGPWSAESRLFVADRKGHDGWTYDAYAHPEHSEQGGRVLYVTYTRPTGVGWFGSEIALWRVVLE